MAWDKLVRLIPSNRREEKKLIAPILAVAVLVAFLWTTGLHAAIPAWGLAVGVFFSALITIRCLLEIGHNLIDRISGEWYYEKLVEEAGFHGSQRLLAAKAFRTEQIDAGKSERQVLIAYRKYKRDGRWT